MKKPPITCHSVLPTFAVTDLEQTLSWYVENLGFELRFTYGDPPTHGAVNLGEASIHFFTGTPQPTSNWTYFHVENVDDLHEWVKANGVEITRPPETYPWKMREFNIVDLNGYTIHFGASVCDD